MLPREKRLTSDYEFRRVRRDGSRYGNSFFGLFVLNVKQGPARFGFVVGTRVSPLAVQRNRIKRILRAEVSRLLPQIRPGVWGAFWVREAARQADPKILRRSVHEALQSTKALL